MLTEAQKQAGYAAAMILRAKGPSPTVDLMPYIIAAGEAILAVSPEILPDQTNAGTNPAPESDRPDRKSEAR